MLTYSAVDLVFYGVDTVANIELNGSPLGNTDNMFIRYKFEVKNLLRVSSHFNSIEFKVFNGVKITVYIDRCMHILG